MRIPSMFEGARYVGRAEGDRKTYYVFEGNSNYLIVAPSSPTNFNVTALDREVPEVLTKRFRGKRLTAKRVQDGSRRPDLFDLPFASLNALYLMVGLGRARKLKQREGKAMVFKIR